jgi:methionyl-tRNA formyltransferase
MKFGIFTKDIHVTKLVNFLNTLGIDYIISTSKEEIRAFDFDIGVSYCFPYIVDVNEVVCGKKRFWYNYHPAPLPEYPGLNNYSIPIQRKVKEFGVTLHRMTNKLDSGKVIAVKKFSLESCPVNTNELGNIAHYYLFQLFKETITSLETMTKFQLEAINHE